MGLVDHVNAVRFETPPHPVYTDLLKLVRDKDYFVITSNVDTMFEKCGYNPESIFTPQGDYALYQCMTPCTHETWPFKPIVDRILPTINPDTQEVTDPSVIPNRPNCGGEVFMNVRGGSWFVEEPYFEQAARFRQWVADAETPSEEGRLLIIEIGAGFNTPSVVRWPMENITDNLSNPFLIRVNPDHPEVPEELHERAMSIATTGARFIGALNQQANLICRI